MTYQCKQVDIGDKCVECLRPTSFGSGLFVNRIPADNNEYIGWLCPECNFYECDRCDKKIYCDDDITPNCVYLDPDITEFFDGAYRVHYECLTESEKECMEKNYGEEESDYEKYKDDPRNLANDPKFKHLQKEKD